MNKQEVRDLVSGHCEKLLASDKKLKDIFEIMFSRPQEIMVEWLEDGKRCTMTFEEGQKRIRNAAFALNKAIGARNEYVALDMENSPNWIIAFWGILMSGNRPYLVNRRHPAALTQGILNTLNIMFSVAEGEINYPCMYIDFARELRITGHEDFGKDGGAPFADEFALSTSATTMNEVICIYTGEQVASQILNCKGILLQNSLMPTFYEGALKQLAFLPFYHVFGLMAVYFWFSFFGRTMAFMSDMSPDSILGAVKELKVTHIFAVPMLWHTIEKQVKAQVHAKGEKTEKKFYKGLQISTRLQSIFPKAGRRWARKMFREVTEQLFGDSPAFLISGGGYLKESALYMFNALGYPLHNGYGMSETGITSVELRETITARNENSVGKPFDSITYDINEDGVLMISGDSICKKIIKNGEVIELGGTYNSGDIASVDALGNYFLKGRKGDRIIGENGENINPDEIEKLLEIPFTREICVWGYGEGADEEIAFVAQIDRELSTEKIRQITDEVYKQNEKLPAAWQIRRFFFSFDPIRSEKAIKVSRPYLKKGIADGSIMLAPFEDVLSGNIKGREPVAEDDETGRKLQAIFAEFTGKNPEDIMMDDHFMYDLGGNSLDYMSLVIQVKEQFGVHLDFGRETAAYSIRQFEKVLEGFRN